MDRKEEELRLNIPEAEIMDFWEESSEYVIYDTWDRIKEWIKSKIK